ncbi:hypothetical protein, partial [Arthrobacter sp. UYCu723]
MSKTKNAPNAAKVKPVYWHGGDGGLTVGDSLLPSNQIPAMKLLYSRTPKEILGTHDPDFAYITTNLGLAFNYALRHAQITGRPAAVYKVAPSGKPLHDVDYPVGVSFRCRTAVVLGIEGDKVNGDEALSVEGLQANTWHDDTQLYDPEGYPSPNDLQKKFGITPADLRGMGVGAPMDHILKTVSEVIQIKNPGITQDEINAADPKFVL